MQTQIRQENKKDTHAIDTDKTKRGLLYTRWFKYDRD